MKLVKQQHLVQKTAFCKKKINFLNIQAQFKTMEMKKLRNKPKFHIGI